jgi:hypothetical protein
MISAEFGNHDLERHTAEYLKDFALFPKVTLIGPNIALKNTANSSGYKEMYLLFV